MAKEISKKRLLQFGEMSRIQDSTLHEPQYQNLSINNSCTEKQKTKVHTVRP